MKQLKIYDSEDNLLSHMAVQISGQMNSGLIEDEIRLYIGGEIKTEIDFIFNFGNIIKRLTVDEHGCSTVCSYTLYFDNVVFKQKVDFSGVTFKKEVNFMGACFEQEADFSGVTFENIVDFYRAHFQNKVNFINVDFQNKVNFNCTSFKKIAWFKNSTLKKEVNFMAASFTQEANFYYVDFQKEVDFMATCFIQGANFYDVDFQNKTNFTSTKIKKILKFDNIKLSDKSNVYFGNIHNRGLKIEIIKTVINGRIDFNNVHIEKINFEGSNVSSGGIINRINFEPECENSDTARFLKHEEIKRNDTIKALKYKGIEKDLYLEEQAKKKNKTFQTKMEIVSIWISKHSNNHGQNWGQAVIFTIVVFTGCFTIYYTYLPISCDTFNGEFFSELIKYFVPINYSSLENYVKIEYIHPFIRTCGVIVYMLGKIGTAYGIVQIVQAFRKFNKVT